MLKVSSDSFEKMRPPGRGVFLEILMQENQLTCIKIDQSRLTVGSDSFEKMRPLGRGVFMEILMQEN